MKGTLTYSVGSDRGLEEIKENYKGCKVEELEPNNYHIIVDLEFDPKRPFKAMENFQEESGEDCSEIFSIELENGISFTEEDY